MLNRNPIVYPKYLEGVWIGSISKLKTYNSKHMTQKLNSFLKTLSHSKPKTEKNCLAPISQNRAPHLSSQFFHFLVESTACTGQKVGFLSRVSSSLSFHPILFCLPISTDTHTPNLTERSELFLFFFLLYTSASISWRPITCKQPIGILKTHHLQTANWWVPFLSLFYLYPKRTPKSPNFGWNPSPSNPFLRVF